MAIKIKQVQEALPDWSPEKEDTYRATCPAHEGDKGGNRKGLQFWKDAEGHVGFKCYAGGCTTDAIIAAMHLAYVPPEPLTMEALAGAKGVPVEVLKQYGVTNGPSYVSIPYHDAQGKVVATRRRLNLSGENRFLWVKGAKVQLYGLLQLAESASDVVLLVEGETDVWACSLAGITAVGVPGASTWKPEMAASLEGKLVYVWSEPDEAGAEFPRRIGKDIPTALVIKAPPDAKDPCALRALDPDNFPTRMRQLMAEATPMAAIKAKEVEEALATAQEDASELLAAPDVVPLLKKAITDGGFAGDVRPAFTSFITLQSRVLPQPLNTALIAQSASGKNFAVDSVLPFFPPQAYVGIDASSPTAIIYRGDSYKNRIVIVGEADSIPEEGPVASAIRNLMSKNSLEYDVTEKGEDGVHRARRITKPGPTGLMTTGTKSLRAQADTRMLQVSISDAPGLTRAINESQAQKYMGNAVKVDYTPWCAYQDVLFYQGPYDVVVPFSGRLADLVPSNAVAMRRAFPQLNTVIQVFAVMRQHQRERDDRGRLIAEPQDYEDARWLLEQTFEAKTSGGLTTAIRETVEAVASLYQNDTAVTEAKLIERLELSRTAIQYRVNMALRDEWVINLASKGQKRALIPGSKLPDANPLPSTFMVCGVRPENHSAVRQLPPSTADPPGSQSAEVSTIPAGSSSAVGSSSAEDSAVEGSPPSHAEQSAEVPSQIRYPRPYDPSLPPGSKENFPVAPGAPVQRPNERIEDEGLSLGLVTGRPL